MVFPQLRELFLPPTVPKVLQNRRQILLSPGEFRGRIVAVFCDGASGVWRVTKKSSSEAQRTGREWLLDAFGEVRQWTRIEHSLDFYQRGFNSS